MALNSQKETGEPIQPLPSADGLQQGAITRFIVCGNLFEARARTLARWQRRPQTRRGELALRATPLRR